MTLRKEPKNIGNRRNELLGILGDTITLTSDKLDTVKIKVKDRQSWGRLLIAAISEYNKILTSTELDDLIARVERLEKTQKEAR